MFMIHFDETYVKKVLEYIKNEEELRKVRDDLNEIWRAKTLAYRWMLREANEIEQKIRKKYPIIDVMLNIASKMQQGVEFKSVCEKAQMERVVERLQQDYCGILCHVAIKKSVIHSIKEFIAYIDAE